MKGDTVAITSINCNHCGASLEATVDTRFVTCGYCGAHLEVRRTETSAFTQEVKAIAQNTDQIANDVAAIRLQNELERIDREWSIQQAAATPSNTSRKSGPGGVLGLVFVGFFAVVCFGMAAMAGSHGAPCIFMLVPIGMGIFALVAGVVGFNAEGRIKAAQADYQRRRESLLRQIEESRRS